MPTKRSANLLGALALAAMDKLRDEPAATLTTRAALLAISKYPGCSIDGLLAKGHRGRPVPALMLGPCGLWSGPALIAAKVGPFV